MATDVERLIVTLEASTKKYENALAKSAADTDRKTRAMEQRFSQLSSKIDSNMARGNKALAEGFKTSGMERSFSGMASSLGGISRGALVAGGAIAAAGAAAAVMAEKVISAGDSWNQVGNRLKTAGVASKDLAEEQSRVAEMALRSHASLAATADLYAKMINAAKAFGGSNQQAADATEAVAKALSLAGVSGQQAEGAIVQLGQALGSGVLRGDEFNSLIESLGTSSPLIKAIAAEFGIATDQLRSFAAEGGLTSQRVFKALVAAKPAIDDMARDAVPSLSQAWTDLDTSITHALATMGQGTGVASGLSNAMTGVARAINDAANAYDAWSRKSFSPTLVDDLQKAQGMVDSLELKLKNRQARGGDDDEIRFLQRQLDMWKPILATMEQAAKVQEKITQDAKEAAAQKREQDSTVPSAADKAVIDKADRAAGIDMSDRDKKIAAAADKLVEALKKAGSKLSETAMQSYATAEATRQYNAQEARRLADEGTSGTRSDYLNRMYHVESGGRANAQAETSTAAGIAQFTEGTWMRIMKKYFADQIAGMSRPDVLKMRYDPSLSKQAAEKLTIENEDYLKQFGIAINDTTRYLAHFLGSAGARAVLLADKGTPVNRVIGADQVNANKSILQGKTVDEVIAWASRKMNAGRIAAGDLTPEEKTQKSTNDILDKTKEDTAEIKRNTEALTQNAYQKAYNAKMAEQLKDAKAKEIPITDELRRKLEDEAKTYATMAAAEDTAKKQKAGQEILDKTKEDTADLQRNSEALTQNSYQVAYNAKMAEQLNDAKAKGIPITDEFRRKLEEEARSYASTAVSGDQHKKQVESLKNLYQELGDMSVDALAGILDGSKSAKEALQDMLKMLLRMMLQASLMGQGPLAGLFGGGGGLFGALGGLFGGGGVSIGANGLLSADSFDDGGYTGPGGRKTPAGVVHKGEVVWSQADVRRHGGPAIVDAMRRGLPGFANGGPVGMAALSQPRMSDLPRQSARPVKAGDLNLKIDLAGANGDATIERIVRRGVGQGIAAYDKGLRYSQANQWRSA
ncbi:tape measure protein [Labrys sp. (in: a-proteobacteria)]|uniref:tape measure protein n=1 Tax=Labrys sp. (in: a-proteobacteria) TaxID=1917972 RepID=UPI0039E617D2